MPKAQVSKTKPVPILTPVEDCELYVTINTRKKEAEKELDTLKPHMLSLIPKGRDQEEFKATRNGVFGRYIITRVAQDRRVIDDEKLAVKLQEKNLYVQACTTKPDHDKVAKLIEEGRFSKEELQECLVGSQPVYPTVKFEPSK